MFFFEILKKIFSKNEKQIFQQPETDNTHNPVTPKQIMLRLDRDYLFKEFIYFIDNHEADVVDFVLCLDETIIAIHWIKEIAASRTTLEEAGFMIENNINELFSNSTSTFINRRNHKVKLLDRLQYENIYNIIIYHESSSNIAQHNAKIFKSTSSKFYHVVSDKDFRLILDTLFTPKELSTFLQFRETFDYPEKPNNVDEADIINQYLSKNYYGELSDSYTAHINDIKLASHDWRKIIHSLFTSTVSVYGYDNDKHNYYFILKQLARLNLQEALQFKDKFFIAYENTINYTLRASYEADNTNSGFVFIQHNKKDSNLDKHQQLYNMILNSHQYQHNFPICIAIVFSVHPKNELEEYHRILWWVHSFPWSNDTY